jgi:Type IV secretory system Conjugative DNA transfer
MKSLSAKHAFLPWASQYIRTTRSLCRIAGQSGSHSAAQSVRWSGGRSRLERFERGTTRSHAAVSPSVGRRSFTWRCAHVKRNQQSFAEISRNKVCATEEKAILSKSTLGFLTRRSTRLHQSLRDPQLVPQTHRQVVAPRQIGSSTRCLVRPELHTLGLFEVFTTFCFAFQGVSYGAECFAVVAAPRSAHVAIAGEGGLPECFQSNATSWLAIPSLARLVCGQGFRTRNLLSGKLDGFINLPLKVLQTSPQAARVILGALLNAVYEARGASASRILFLLDEVARLGYMGILETARDTGRKYGINLCLLHQSLGQLTQSWGHQGRQAWFDSAYLRLFSHIQDYEAADFLSEACGEFTALGDSITEGSGSSSGWDRSTSSTHRSTNQQQIARRLIKPEEVLQSLRYDEQIVLIQNAPPLRCGRAIYFRRSDMLARVKGGGGRAEAWRCPAHLPC